MRGNYALVALSVFFDACGRFVQARLHFRRGLGGWLGEPVRGRVRALRRSVPADKGGR